MGSDTPAEEKPQPRAPSPSFLKERRFKLSRACDRCRRRRIKCDEGHPCQACLNAKSACTFEEPSKRHPHKSKRTATLEDRMHHLETLISAIPPAVFAAGAGGVQNNGTSPTTTDSLNNPININTTNIEPENNHAISPTIPFLSAFSPSSAFPLINPSTHFSTVEMANHTPVTTAISGPAFFNVPSGANGAGGTEARSNSYLYFDDEGFTRWQGETSGLPLLDLLVERHAQPNHMIGVNQNGSPLPQGLDPPPQDWFPDRTLKKPDFNPQTMWRIITSQIAPDLMDSLVQCYLSTTYYILPFLHIPTFLSDYGNPQKWGEPGFAAFIVAVCCLASRHVEDPRVRTDPKDGITAGTHYFTLLDRLRTLPMADRPTLYTIQADLIAAVYAVGLGKLTKAASLLSEAVAISIDAGLHRSSGSYDLFDPIEDEIRKRTFWCVYLWDKQLSAHFGRPCLMRLRDCDVEEPAMVDDEFITRDEGIVAGSPQWSVGGVKGGNVGMESRMAAFVLSLRMIMVLESVLDVPPPPPPPSLDQQQGCSDFMAKVNLLHRPGAKGEGLLLAAEEGLLNEIHRSIPSYWLYSNLDTFDDTVRVTQAGRLHCAEQFVRLLIYRCRFAAFVEERMNNRIVVEDEREREAVVGAYTCALEIVNTYLAIARKGLMTYYGVHVIHQLTQAGRTLVAVLLNCNSPPLEGLIPNGLEAVRNCVGLLRRFSGRYVCGLRSGDLMEEFCRLTHIPLESMPREDPLVERARPAWIRPVRKKASSAARSASNASDSPSPPSNPFGGAQPPQPTAAGAASSTSDSHQSPPERVFDSPLVSGGGGAMDFESGTAPTDLNGGDLNGMGGMNLNLMAFLGGPSPVPTTNTATGELDINQFFNADAMLGCGEAVTFGV